MKKTKLITILITICAFVGLMLRPVFAIDEAEKGEDNTILIEYDFERPMIRKVNIAGKIYNTVTIEGVQSIGNIGEPALPIPGAKVLIPYGKKIVSSEAILGESEDILLDYQVVPVQRPYPLSYTGKIEPVLPDPEIYSQTTVFPSNDFKFVSLQKMAGNKIAIFNLFPVRYLPSKHKLIVYKKITLKLTLGPLEKEPDAIKRKPIQDRLLSFVDNKEDVISIFSELFLPNQKDRGFPFGIEGPFEYVIITNEELRDAQGEYTLQDLVAFRQSQGLTATIVITEDIYANPDYAGLDNQEEIRNFIIDAYNSWNTQYILLGGDGDGGDTGGESGDVIIPPRLLYEYQEVPDGYIEDFIAADLYYACLDGTFDFDADGIYGEETDGEAGGEVDLLAEVYVGRAPVDSALEVSNFVRKTLAYEDAKTSLSPYLWDTYHVGEYLWNCAGYPEFGKDSLEEMRLGCDDIEACHGFTNVGFSDMPYTTNSLYDKDYYEAGLGSWPVSEIINVINSNVSIINHLGHGWVDLAMKMHNPEVDSLTNTEYFIGYSQTCYAGSFDNLNTRDDVLSTDSIVEHFMTEEHGAVAFIANSRSGWGTVGSTAGSSQFFARTFWDMVFGEQIIGLGQAHQDSKENVPNLDLSWDMKRWTYFALNLFGDPALEIFVPSEPPLVCGDIDGSGSEVVDISDLVYIIDYMFTGGPAPDPLWVADVDGDGEDLNISDLVYLIDYMFTCGPAPDCDGTGGQPPLMGAPGSDSSQLQNMTLEEVVRYVYEASGRAVDLSGLLVSSEPVKAEKEVVPLERELRR